MILTWSKNERFKINRKLPNRKLTRSLRKKKRKNKGNKKKLVQMIGRMKILLMMRIYLPLKNINKWKVQILIKLWMLRRALHFKLLMLLKVLHFKLLEKVVRLIVRLKMQHIQLFLDLVN